MNSHKVQWFARGGDVLRMGPFDSQADATRALILSNSPRGMPTFPPDAFVWPEYIEEEEEDTA